MRARERLVGGGAARGVALASSTRLVAVRAELAGKLVVAVRARRPRGWWWSIPFVRGMLASTSDRDFVAAESFLQDEPEGNDQSPFPAERMETLPDRKREPFFLAVMNGVIVWVWRALFVGLPVLVLERLSALLGFPQDSFGGWFQVESAVVTLMFNFGWTFAMGQSLPAYARHTAAALRAVSAHAARRRARRRGSRAPSDRGAGRRPADPILTASLSLQSLPT